MWVIRGNEGLGARITNAIVQYQALIKAFCDMNNPLIKYRSLRSMLCGRFFEKYAILFSPEYHLKYIISYIRFH